MKKPKKKKAETMEELSKRIEELEKKYGSGVDKEDLDKNLESTVKKQDSKESEKQES